MKKTLSLILLSISLTVSAQLKFTSADTVVIRRTADSIALNTKQVYVFSREGISDENSNYYIICYLNKNDAQDKLNILFRFDVSTNEYQLNSIVGKFENLFPAWLKFINPLADAKTVVENQRDDITVNRLNFSFREWGSYWKIEAHPIMN